jgi:hypothetical protein
VALKPDQAGTVSDAPDGIAGGVHAGGAPRRPLRLAYDRNAGGQARATRTAAHPLDQLLASLERGELSASELRILLAVLDRDITVSELARTLGRPPAEIRHTGERLYARGLLSWRDDARSGETTLGTTRAGVATVRPVLTAVAGSRIDAAS